VPRSLHLAVILPVDRENNTGLTLPSFPSRRYYHAFTRAYAVSLLFADEIMTNSSWTSGHISSLLKLGRGTWAAYLLNLDDTGRAKASKTDAQKKENTGDRNDRVVFPPCDTSEFLHLPLEDRHQSHTLISLAQFRPEKDQAKQLRALAILFERYPQWRDVQVDSGQKKGVKTGLETAGSGKGVKLVLMGSCRDEADERRIDGLRRLAKDLGIEVSPEYRVAILPGQTPDCSF
jgi:alpha-1,2-mannosyltransferase